MVDIEGGESSEQVGINELAAGDTPRKFTRMMATLIPYAETWSQRKSNKEALEQISTLPELFSVFGAHELFLQTL